MIWNTFFLVFLNCQTVIQTTEIVNVIVFTFIHVQHFQISLTFKGEESEVALEGNEIDASTDDYDAENSIFHNSGNGVATVTQVNAA